MTTQIPVDIDPLAILIEERKERHKQRKIELTKLTESYCKICKDTRPIEHFDVYKVRTGHRPHRICKKCYKRKTPKKRKSYKDSAKTQKSVKAASQKACRLLSDSYIKRLYCKLGFKFKDVTPEMIISKRKEVLAIRASAAAQTYKVRRKTGYYDKLDTENLKDSYIRGRIKSSVKYKGEEITKEMIEVKREEIKRRRYKMTLKEVRRKAKQRKEENKKPYVFSSSRNIK